MPLRCDVVCPIPGGTVPSGIGMENTVRKTILAALSATLVLAAPVAHADTRDLEDPLGDVMTATLQDNWEFKYNREHGAEGDIVFARIQHTAKQVIVYLRYAQLTVPKQRFAYYSYQFEGTNDARVGVGIQTRQRKPQGGSYAYSSVRRKCVVAHHFNYGADSLSMRMPRTCIGNAKYVRLTHLSLRMPMTESDELKIYYDSPARDGGTLNQVFSTPTPWVVTG